MRRDTRSKLIFFTFIKQAEDGRTVQEFEPCDCVPHPTADRHLCLCNLRLFSQSSYRYQLICLVVKHQIPSHAASLSRTSAFDLYCLVSLELSPIPIGGAATCL